MPVNPYLPPGAAVADVGLGEEAGHQPIQLFSWRGRIGRARFIAYSVWGYLLTIVVLFVLGMVASMFGNPLIGLVVGLVGVIPYALLIGFASVQRSHDMGWSGWSTLLMLIPFVGLVWVIKGGTPGRNPYGLPPPPNPLSVVIGAWLMLVLFIGGIALAAYSVSMFNEINAGAKAALQNAK
jgi:uncharacterized membrane protein YhaH (DUF805 family)